MRGNPLTLLSICPSLIMLTVGNHMVAWKGVAWHGMEFRVLNCNGMRFMNRMEYLVNGRTWQPITTQKKTVYREP